MIGGIQQMTSKRGSEEHRERISRGVRRAWERRRTREGVRPVHVDRWLRDGAVAPALVPILKTRAAQIEDMIADLGGPAEVTAMQRALLDGWLKAAVAADMEFARLAQGNADGTPQPLATFLNTVRAHLTSLGIERRAKPVGKPNETSPVSRLGSGLSFKPLPCSSAPHPLRTQQV